MVQDSRPVWKRAFAGKADFARFVNCCLEVLNERDKTKPEAEIQQMNKPWDATSDKPVT